MEIAKIIIKYFQVILIGNNYVIRNLYINSSRYGNGDRGIGFFGIIKGGTIISNLSVTGNIICKETNAQKKTGGIAGMTSGNGIEIFKNCNNYCNITSYGYAGGILGGTLGAKSKTKIIECTNYGNIKILGRRIWVCRRYMWNFGK